MGQNEGRQGGRLPPKTIINEPNRFLLVLVMSNQTREAETNIRKRKERRGDSASGAKKTTKQRNSWRRLTSRARGDSSFVILEEESIS
eukprot:scaffold8462_cov107-Cylindrotheca_fusiformis.AAC.1